MALPFRRSSRSVPAAALRQWMVETLLSTLTDTVSLALYEWLLSPTDLRRWPPPETFSERRLPLRQKEYWNQPSSVACDLLRNELKAIRQTLDLPPEALSGLTRNGLLTVHAIRLRQLEWRLWPGFAARKIREMTV